MGFRKSKGLKDRMYPNNGVIFGIWRQPHLGDKERPRPAVLIIRPVNEQDSEETSDINDSSDVGSSSS